MAPVKAIKPPVKKGREEGSGRREAASPRGLGRLGAWWSSWRRSTKAAATRARGPRPVPTPRKPTSAGALRLSFAPLAVAAAHDGALRGLPDPTLLLAVFAVDDKRRLLRPALRAVVRYRLTGRAPCDAQPEVEHVVTAGLRCARALIVATLWEENSGVDIRALASALERPEDLHLVDLRGATPDVHAAYDAVGGRELGSSGPLAALSPRGILVESIDAARTRSDTWVGGAAVVVPASPLAPVQHRLALRSADGRQDWTIAFSTGRA
jgi:hypothetical protein